MHVLESHAHGYETYVAAFKCDDKQGEIARQSVEIAECHEALAAKDAELKEATEREQRLREWHDGPPPGLGDYRLRDKKGRVFVVTVIARHKDCFDIAWPYREWCRYDFVVAHQSLADAPAAQPFPPNSGHAGWAIYHPDGSIELDYFHMTFPRPDSKNPEAGQDVESWRRTYRPNCQIKRVGILGKAAVQPSEAERPAVAEAKRKSDQEQHTQIEGNPQ